jgi:hypothetical protein
VKPNIRIARGQPTTVDIHVIHLPRGIKTPLSFLRELPKTASRGAKSFRGLVDDETCSRNRERVQSAAAHRKAAAGASELTPWALERIEQANLESQISCGVPAKNRQRWASRRTNGVHRAGVADPGRHGSVRGGFTKSSSTGTGVSALSRTLALREMGFQESATCRRPDEHRDRRAGAKSNALHPGRGWRRGAR